MKNTSTEIEVQKKTGVAHRVSIGLIAVSLSLMSLALGLTLLTIPLPASVFLAVPVVQQSAATSATAVTVAWTAPGDDGNTGQATSYDMRYSSSPITADTFSAATSVSGLQLPQPAGSTESFTVNGLLPATTYFFALKSSDEAGNVSAMSNVVSQTTASILSACVPVYQCSDWSACVNGQQTRTCSTTNGCPAGLDAPVSTQTCTAPVGGTAARLLRHEIAVALAPGSAPVFRLVTPSTLKVEREILAFARTDRHGLNVAVGDLDGDRQPDIVAGSGAGTSPQIKLFNRSGTLIAKFSPYPVSPTSGVAVAVADINGDGRDDLLTIPAKGAAQLRAFKYDAKAKRFTQIAQAFVYVRSALNGFSLAAGDLDLDGKAEIVVAPRTNGNSVSVMKLSGSSFKRVSLFRPYPLVFRTGMSLAIGDTDGNGRNEIITTAGPGYYSNVKVQSMTGKTQASFIAISKSYLNGLTISAMDVNQDGRDEIVSGPYQGGDPTLRVYRYSGLTHAFSRIAGATVFSKTIRVGLRVASQ